MSDYKNKIIVEQYLNGIDMSYEERDNYLKIIEECKEISNTIFKVGNTTRGNIVEITLKKEDRQIKFSGSINYNDKCFNENRSIYGVIYLNKNNVVVDMIITRLCVDDNKVYTTIDEFNNEIHKTIYNKDLGIYEDIIKTR